LNKNYEAASIPGRRGADHYMLPAINRKMPKKKFKKNTAQIELANETANTLLSNLNEINASIDERE
jgi:hypothetical protein